MKPHPDEVDEVKWVTPEEMDAMMDDQGKWPLPKSFARSFGLFPPSSGPMSTFRIGTTLAIFPGVCV